MYGAKPPLAAAAGLSDAAGFSETVSAFAAPLSANAVPPATTAAAVAPITLVVRLALRRCVLLIGPCLRCADVGGDGAGATLARGSRTNGRIRARQWILWLPKEPMGGD
ncbi:hypothetical protein SANTM175S_10896 [Streptomyces antimycoticus]